jgi:signal peptidase II
MLLLFAVTPGLALLVLDQWSKRAVQQRAIGSLRRGGKPVRFRCVMHGNTVYRSMSGRLFLLFLWVASFASAILLHRYGTYFQSTSALAGRGLALGGAAGNLFDVVQHRAIVNFIDVGWRPVFNLADTGILAGLMLALWRPAPSFRRKRQRLPPSIYLHKSE